jgi:hypothetical protein
MLGYLIAQTLLWPPSLCRPLTDVRLRKNLNPSITGSVYVTYATPSSRVYILTLMRLTISARI